MATNIGGDQDPWGVPHLGPAAGAFFPAGSTSDGVVGGLHVTVPHCDEVLRDVGRVVDQEHGLRLVLDSDDQAILFEDRSHAWIVVVDDLKREEGVFGLRPPLPEPFAPGGELVDMGASAKRFRSMLRRKTGAEPAFRELTYPSHQ